VVGVALGLALGTLGAGVAGALPPLGSGAVGAAVAILSYSLVWYYGIRWFAKQ
jgi:hypothetical protein